MDPVVPEPAPADEALCPTEVHWWLVSMVRGLVAGKPHGFDRFDDLTDAEVSALLFHHTDRDGKPRGMRLTKLGLDMVGDLFKRSTIDLENKRLLTGRHILFLDRNCTMPYYSEGHSLVLFDLILATKLRLCGDDLDTLISLEN